MKNNKYNLQVLHREEVFETRELALGYLTDYYKPNSLEAEPVLVKYGDSRNPNAILAFGTSDAAPGSFFAIDMAKAEEQIEGLLESVDSNKEELDYVAEILDGVVKATGLTIDENKIEDKVSYEPDSRDDVIGSAVTIAEAIDLLSKYAQNGFADNELSVEDTESVTLIYTVNPDGGKLLKAKVNISTDGDSDELNFNNNIIGIKNDGLYAASNLAYDDARHQLIFTTSGYKNGRYQDDAIVQRVDLGEHTKLLADNEGRTVKLIISENASNYTTTLSADLQIADRENNILKVADGKVYVDGLAKNIKYGDSNVATALNNHKDRLNVLETDVQNAAKSAHIEGGQTDTLETQISELADGGAKVTGNVRLGSTNSIVVRNGGLEANITVDVDTATNKLIVTIGNETIVKTLPGVELFESAEYNDENEELIITFRTGNTLVIPIHGIIHTWETSNPQTSAVVLTKTVVTGGVDTLSGDVKLRSTDNLIAKENGNLYVSESNINNKVSTETSRATAAEQALGARIDALTTNVNDQISGVEDSIGDVRDALTAETARAREAENEIAATANHADEVATEAKETVTELNSTVATLSTDLSTLETKVENIEGDVAEIAVLRNALNDEITARTNKDTEIEGKITAANTAIATETSRAEAAEAAMAEDIEELAAAVGSGSAQTLADAKAYTDTKVTAEKTEREAADVAVNTRIDTLETKHDTEIANAIHTASDDATAKANAAESAANEYTDTEVLAEKNRAEAAEQANADAIAANTDAITAETARATAAEQANADAIEDLEDELNAMKFITDETDTVKMTMVQETGAETRVLSSDVKLKTLSGEAGNIIKSDANGLYATILFDYNKAENKITFNDGNGEKVFELNNFGILQDAFYDSEDKSIVLIVKKDDETTERITIPVADLVNTWSVENDANSPVILQKTAGDEGDVLSANISILNNEHNLLVNENGSLFVDADSNQHIALWGGDVISVQGAINLLKERTDDIEEMKQDIEDLEEDNQNIKMTLYTIQTDLSNLENRVTVNEGNIEELQDGQEALQTQVNNLSDRVDTFDSRIEQAEQKAEQAIETANSLVERIERIETVIEQLIDFGEYPISL